MITNFIFVTAHVTLTDEIPIMFLLKNIYMATIIVVVLFHLWLVCYNTYPLIQGMNLQPAGTLVQVEKTRTAPSPPHYLNTHTSMAPFERERE